MFVSDEFLTNFPVLIIFVPNLINFGFFKWQLLEKLHICEGGGVNSRIQ